MPLLYSVVFYTRVAWVVFAVMYGKRLFSSVFAITEKRDMGLYEVPLSMSFFGMGAMLANFHMCGIMLMCFRYLMFSLSGPGELVFFTLFYCLLDLSCCECDVISLYFMCCSVNGSVCLVCCVFDSV